MDEKEREEKERKVLESTKPENRSIIRDTANQRTGTWAGALVAEVFGMFVIFSLVQPIESGHVSSFVVARDGLLLVGSVLIAFMIGVTFVRLYHQNMIVVKVRDLSDLEGDQLKFDLAVDELTKSRFPLLAQTSIYLTGHPRVVLILGVLVFVLLWIAALL